MKTLLLSSVLAFSTIVGAQAFEPFPQLFPEFDVPAQCKVDRDPAYCITTQYLNRGLAVSRWTHLSPAVQVECIEAAKVGGNTYRALYSCIDAHRN